MPDKSKYPIFILGLAGGLAAAWLVQRQFEQNSNMNLWLKAIEGKRGLEFASLVRVSSRAELAALMAGVELPQNPRLRWHLTDNILPGLALYRALLKQHNGNKLAALADIDAAFAYQTRAHTHWMAFALRLPIDPFTIFKLGFRQTMKDFPPEGWDITYAANDDQRVAFNITRCFYLNTLTSLGAPELTAAFCKSDDVMAAWFPPGLRFVREHTLGRGDAVCDFQYCRGAAGEIPVD